MSRNDAGPSDTASEAGSARSTRHEGHALGYRLLPALQAVSNHEATRLLLAGVVIGVLAGVAAGIFDRSLIEVSRIFLGEPEPSVIQPVWWKALVGPAVCGGLAAVMLRLGGRPKGSPQGITDAIANTRTPDHALSMRAGLASAAAGLLVVGGGQSGGREAPIIQLGSTFAGYVCRFLRVPRKHTRALVAAGGGAALAASFNTPLGGAFFALEIILGNFAVEAFAPVVAATVTATAVGQALLGDRIALKLPPFRLENPFELVLYLLLGLGSGVIAVVFKRGLDRWDRLYDQLRLPRWAQPGVAGLLVGIIAALGMYPVMGNGYAYDQVLLSGADGITMGFLALLLVAKLVATVFTRAGHGGAGLLAPTVFIGMLTGTLMGKVYAFLWPGQVASAGAYGMVGMGALTAAVLQAPITMVLLIYGMTREYQVILPLLLALGVASMVSSLSKSRGIYDTELEHAGIKATGGREELVMYDLTVGDVMREEGFDVVQNDAPFRELARLFLQHRVDEVYVLDAQGRFDGLVDIQDIKSLLVDPRKQAGVRVADLETRSVPVLSPDQALADALPFFFRSALEDLPVVDSKGKLVGVLTERDVIGAYHREVLRKDALLARVESGDKEDRHTDFVELPPGQVLEAVEVSGQLAGRTLRELKLPQRYRCTVVAVSVWNPDLGRWERRSAEANLRLKHGDRLVVIGPLDKVRALKTPEPDYQETVEIPREALQQMLRRKGRAPADEHEANAGPHEAEPPETSDQGHKAGA